MLLLYTLREKDIKELERALGSSARNAWWKREWERARRVAEAQQPKAKERKDNGQIQ